MSDKLLLLITGGNQGLGLRAIQQLSATNNYHILMGARDITKAAAAIQALTNDDPNAESSNVEPLQIDMSSDASITAAAKTIADKYGHLDILMPNAGIAQATGTLREQYAAVYDTNLFGTAFTIDAFLPLLRASTKPGGKRIAITTSDLASLSLAMADQGLYSAKNFPIYRSSKTALNMVMCHYARTLEGEGFVVTASNPGFCRTEFNGNQGPKDPVEGAKELVKSVVGKGEEVHGRVVTEGGYMEW